MSFIVEGYEKEPRTVKVNHNGNSNSAVEMSTAFGDTGRKFEEDSESEQSKPSNGKSAETASRDTSAEVHSAATAEQKTVAGEHVKLRKESVNGAASQIRESVHTTKAVGVSQADSAIQQGREAAGSGYSHGQESSESLIDRMSDIAENISLQDAKNVFVKMTKGAISIARKITAPALARIQCSVTAKRYEKKFKKSKTATAAGYRFKIGADAIMITEYTGNDVVLKMPNTVLHKPITYVVPGFLNLSGKGAPNIKQVKLPKYLEVIPDGLFLHCYSLEMIVVPPTLEMISREALKGTNPKYVIFTGPCPL